MNFNQSKLTKEEWESIEIPLSNDKLKIINLIVKGFDDINILYNETTSLFSFLKIVKNTKEMDEYLYKIYFSKKVEELYKKYNVDFLQKKIKTNIKIKSSDNIRISNNSTIETSKNIIYEFIILNFIECLFIEKNKTNNIKWIYYYFTINKIYKNSSIQNINSIIQDIIISLISYFKENINITQLIYNSPEYIEKNINLIKYSDISLYDHQKKIFTFVKYNQPKLILYIAPTGTGKTLTPLGLSQRYKIIYVCAARHIGLALAKAAISIKKKIAFAFGCNSSEDIKLHYFSAKEYSVNKKSGGIQKIDNTFGEKVEIIICDVYSYLPAMYYMVSHFDKDSIISYFDEPTIFMDYKNHPLHLTIHKNWKDNIIPNVVLSSATLPKIYEIPDLINSFKEKFGEDAEIFNIVSYECKKTIPILDSNGFISMPHYFYENYNEINKIGNYCLNNLTILRYLDLNECVNFIKFVNVNNYIPSNMNIDRHFTCIEDINMFRIKEYYINLLQNINIEYWNIIYLTLNNNRKKYVEYIENNENNDNNDNTSLNKLRKIHSISSSYEINKQSNSLGKSIYKSESVDSFKIQKSNNEKKNISLLNDFGIYFTTKDAYTLTDGPTLFITDDVEKIADFCIKQSKIPDIFMNEISEKIVFNDEITKRIIILEKELEDIKEKKINKNNNDNSSNNKKNKITLNDEKDVGVNKINIELSNIYSLVKSISLNDTFVPNKKEHLQKWNLYNNNFNSFTSDISDDIIIKIMSLNVNTKWKILLLLGIGVFTENNNTSYNEIIKKLAETQKLYLIIANSDYIYGVNYQFCHTYIGKDIQMTQEKIIQALGRVGRENIQQTYTIRFRNDEHIKMLFSDNPYKPEVYNMNTLFTTKSIYWNETTNSYEELIN